MDPYTYIILQVWRRPREQYLPAGLVVSVLAGQVQRREARRVARAQLRARVRQQRHAARVALPRRLVSCCVPVLDGNKAESLDIVNKR